ncbi:MAG TPA: FUSC family protein, partial [Solirubrobacteraceae bacterium]|nr:FUSC family protein [Solirubrobacteraceae bacterium]
MTDVQVTGARTRLLNWLAARDRGFSALRRAGRTAIVMPAMFALGDKVIGNPTVATFAAFGSFAMLLLVDFGGPIRDRLRAQALLALIDGAFVCLATLASHSEWIAAIAMSVVAFAVLFAGVVSSVLAGATTSLLLAFILPVSLAGPDSSIPDRLAGWGLASGAALLAVSLLWPGPARDPLRDAAVRACRALSARLRSEVDCVIGGEAAPAQTDHDDVVARADTAVADLRRVFFATPYRPTGLSTATRMVVRLVDELTWLGAVVADSAPRIDRPPLDSRVCAVRSAASSVLDAGADLLAMPRSDPSALHDALASLRQGVTALEQGDTLRLPLAAASGPSTERVVESRIEEFISSLDPSFSAQELSFVVSQIAANVDRAAAADRRSWLARLLGRAPAMSGSALSAVQDRAAAHAERHSVWLHNSLRGAAGLGLAVLVAQLTGVQHGFWVVFGALSVLRSNALTTGQNVLRGLLGTAAGFVVGAALIALIGTNSTVLWLLLPFAVLLAGLAPAAVSFAAGQQDGEREQQPQHRAI